MIVPSMNSEEIVREILLDYKTVRNKAGYLCNQQRRMAMKSKDKLLVKFYDYKSLRKNNWTITIEHKRSAHGTLIATHYLNALGFNVLSIAGDETIFHYSGHFLDRYNERFLKQDHFSKLEVFKRFIIRNTFSSYEFLNPADAEIKQVMIKLNEGVAFGTLERINNHRIVDYRTFISNDMILINQMVDFNFLKQNYESFLNENPLYKKMLI